MEAGTPSERAAISIVVTTYNDGSYLAQTLSSVRTQTLAAAELIVVDDGSTDASVAIAETFGARVLRKTNGGPSSARNAGIRAATQPWIAFLDGDDLWQPEKLARQWEAIRLAPTARFAFSDWTTFDDTGRISPSSLQRRPEFLEIRRRTLAAGISLCDLESLQLALTRAMLFKQSSLLIDRAAIFEAGLFDEEMLLFEDWEFMLRVLTRFTGVAVEESLVAYRRHARSLTWDETALKNQREQLWDRVTLRPAKYPPCAVQFARQGRTRRLCDAALSAIRNGRVADAEQPLRQSLREDPNITSLLLLGVWHFARHPAGRQLIELARSAWRRRPVYRRVLGG